MVLRVSGYNLRTQACTLSACNESAYMCKRKAWYVRKQHATRQHMHQHTYLPPCSRPPGAPAANRRSTHGAQRQPRGARRQRDPRVPTLHQTLCPAPGPACEGPPAALPPAKGTDGGEAPEWLCSRARRRATSAVSACARACSASSARATLGDAAAASAHKDHTSCCREGLKTC